MRTRSLFLLAASALVTATAGAQAPTGGRLTIDQLIQIKHPSAPQWTADGSHIWFTYDSGGVNNLWSVPSDGSGRAVALTTSLQGGRGFAPSPDGSSIAFASGPDVIVHTIATHADLRVARADNTVGNVSWSADGANVIYTVQGTGAAGPIQHPASPPEIGNKLVFLAFEGGGRGAAYTVPATGGTPTVVADGGGGGRGRGGGRGLGGASAVDATHVVSTRTSNGGKTRTTEVIDTGWRCADSAARGDGGEVLQLGQHDEQRRLAGSSLAALHERRHRVGSDLCRADVRRHARAAHEGAGRTLARRVVARQQAHRLGREHGRQAGHASHRVRDDRRRSGHRDDRRP